jgi:hypothetical protein
MSDEKPSEPPSPRELDLVAATLPDSPAEGEDEFAGMEPYRPRRSPILAAAVILISGYLLFHLRHDLSYALQSRTPTPIADVRTFFRDPTTIKDHSYVSARAVPDRATAVMLDAKGKDEFIPFVRVMGTGSRLLLAQRRGLRSIGDVYDDVYAGRLMRLRDVSYAGTVRDHYAKRAAATHFFKVTDVCATLGKAPTRLVALSGDEVALDAERVVGVAVTFRGDYVVTLPRERFPNEADGRGTLEQLGAEVKEFTETKTELRFVTQVADERRDSLMEQLRKLDARSDVQLRKVSYHAPWGHLAAGGEELLLPGTPGHAPCAWATSFTTVEKLHLPADAFVLVEGERPQDLWYVPVFVVFLLLFIGWNTLALVAAIRGRSRTRAPATNAGPN